MKRGLVVEGGGMRGSHTCGAFMAMIDRGMTDFDVVVASSAGACTTAFFVSRQYDLFPTVWTKYLHDGRFIRLKNIALRRSVMDLDFLIHDIFGSLVPLDVEAVRKSTTDFYIVGTRCSTGQPHFFNNHRDPILNSLKASAALPIAYRHPVVIDGELYVDGGISDPIPIQKAIDEGCTEVTLLLTRPLGYRKKSPFLQILPRLYQKKFPHLAETLARRHATYNALMDRLDAGDFPCKLRIVRPSEKTPVSRLTTDIKKIRRTIEQGYRDALQSLFMEDSPEAPKSLAV